MEMPAAVRRMEKVSCPGPHPSRRNSEGPNNKVLGLEGPEVLEGAQRSPPLRFRHRLWGVPGAVLRVRSPALFPCAC
ncbi:hypothetical protein VULLAG_LOCUS4084 [Vulpes lagopus]